MESGGPVWTGAPVGIGACGEQGTNALEVITLDGKRQGRATVGAGSIGVGTAFNGRLYGGDVAAPHRLVQPRRATAS
jgi:hypothetical protein